VKIVNIDPTTDPLWQDLVSRERSDVFHAPAWLRVLKETYDFELRALVAVDEEGVPSSGMAYCKIEDMMDPRIASLPFSDFCDPLVRDREEWNCLIDTLLDGEHRFNMRCLHNQVPLQDERLTLVDRAKWHAIDLQRSEDDLWMGLSGSARRAIKKARREGVEVRIAREKEEIRDFFDLHLGVRKYKYELLAQPYRFFEQIWDHFLGAGKGALMIALFEGRPIGAVLFLEWQNKLYYKFNASDFNYIDARPNDLIVWEGMKYGRAKGHEYLDFGLSDWDQEGLLRYKRKFATDEKTISFLRYMPARSPSPQEKMMRALLPQITDLFVDEAVPDSVTEKAGDTLYRFFT